MNFNRTSTLRFIRLAAIIVVALVIIIFALSRSLNYIHGPKIEIFQPINGSAVASTTVTIIGRADRINALSLNGKTVFIDELGNFKETVTLFPGVNILTLDAHDQFGRETSSQLELVGVNQ